MTDTIDTGEIARPVGPATLPPPDMTARLPLADLTEKILTEPGPGLTGVIAYRDILPTLHYRRPPTLAYQAETALADTMFELAEPGTGTPTGPTHPTTPKPPPPVWANPAAELPVVKPLMRHGRHRQPISRLGWALVGSGVTVLVIFVALAVSVLLGAQW